MPTLAELIDSELGLPGKTKVASAAAPLAARPGQSEDPYADFVKLANACALAADAPGALPSKAAEVPSPPRELPAVMLEPHEAISLELDNQLLRQAIARKLGGV